MKKVKAIGLVSGGLDSILAVEVMKKQNVELVALYIINGFDQETLRVRSNISLDENKWLRDKKAYMTKSLGIDVRIIDISEGFLETVSSARYGYGKNCNPCIDCKISFLTKAKELMLELGADFVFTGEVLGQRPMSQRKQAMDLIEQRSGLEGILLRPLSARILPETEIEKKGWVRREYLLDIQGRSRKRQIDMAADLGITDYPAPAGGCILTDENYSRRLKDLFTHKIREELTPEDTVLLSVGRHFRLADDVKIVVGRDESENEYIEKVCNDGWLAFAAQVPGPTVAIQGKSGEKELVKAASFAARYSDAKEASEVDIIVRKIDQEKTITVSPVSNDELERYRL
ncbi:hypothetical protein J7M07_02150 [bacterium]|nr:hypothetical protein [bacterium]